MKKIHDFYKRLRSITIFKPGIRRWTIIILSAILLAMLVPILFLLAINMDMFGKLPDEQQLQNIRNNIATEIYSADSVLLGRYYYQNRTNTKFENISPYLINALVATEDIRFYDHSGIDFKSWLRVFVKSLILGDRDAGGGSTISQQLAKNLFGRENEAMIFTKSKEALIARRMENIYSKNEILTLYLNTVPFGDNIYGVETAAKRYFNKSAETVNLQEAATLIGMLKANNSYNPRINPKQSRQRRNVVIDQMAKYEFIESSVADSVKLMPIKTDLQLITANTGLATYFREHLRQEMEQWASNNEKEDGSSYNIYADGLKIYTTIDSRLQKYAEDAVKTRMKELQRVFNEHWSTRKPWDRDSDILTTAVMKTPLYQRLKEEGADDEAIKAAFAREKFMKVFSYDSLKEQKMSILDSVKHHLMILHAGLLAMNPETGYIKAWVGGIDHNFFKYDHVNISTKRQVGSIFKPIVYTAALKNGIDPCGFISSSPLYEKKKKDEEEDDWSPQNSNDEYEKKYSMTGGLMYSVNTVSVRVLQNAGIDRIIDLAHSMGIESDIPRVPSIALGTNEASLYEMTQAFCTFANKGEPITPTYISTITDHYGKILERFQPDTTQNPVIEEKYNQMIVEMMKAVVNEGTASRLRWKYNIKNDIAGKTGTTQNNADGWFMAATPELVVGVWVGADDPRVRFRVTSLGQGANTALPVFASFMENINADSTFKNISNAEFPRPSQEVRIMLNCARFIEEKPSLWEMLFGDKEEKKKEKEEKAKEEEKESEGFFKSIGDLFKRKKNDN